LARAWSQQSSLGRMLDPIADKLLVSSVILVLSANQTISGLTLWAARKTLKIDVSEGLVVEAGGAPSLWTAFADRPTRSRRRALLTGERQRCLLLRKWFPQPPVNSAATGLCPTY